MIFRVSQTPACKMPANNLARVFGPTLVGHSVPEPEPSQLISETKYQAMVGTICYVNILQTADVKINFLSASRFPCPGRNFVTIGPNDYRLGIHVSGNDSKVQCTRTLTLPCYPPPKARCKELKVPLA